MNDVIYLEPDDEITLVIDRLKVSSSRVTILVVPRGSSLAQSIVNLKLIKRSAEEQGKEAVFVLNDRIGRNLASQLGLTVYSKVSEAQNANRYEKVAEKRVGNEDQKDGEEYGGLRVNNYARYKEEEDEILAADGVIEEQEITEPDDEAEVVEEKANNVEVHAETDEEDGGSEVVIAKEHQEAEEAKTSDSEVVGITDDKIAAPKVANKIDEGEKMMSNRKKIHGSRKPLVLLILFILIAGLVLSGLFLPYASASVQLKTEEYSRDSVITLSRDATAVSLGSLTIPGKLFEVEKEVTKTYPATGKKDVGEKAKGKITVLNSYDSSSHQYPKGTKFTSSGKTFIADEAFSVAGAQTVLAGGKVSITPGEGSVNVTAEKPGEAYNLAEADYAIDGAPSLISGRGAAMIGGVTKEIKIVTENDLDTAEAEQKSSIATENKKTITESAVNEKYTLIESSLVEELVSTSFTKNANDEAESFDCKVKLKIFGMGFLESDLREIMVQSLQEQLGSGKMLVNPDKSEVNYQVVENSRDLGSLKINATLNGQVGDKIDPAYIKNVIKNKTVDSALNLLAENKSIEKIELRVWPPALERTPLLVNRIRVEFDYAK